jgi:hypothetical protein
MPIENSASKIVINRDSFCPLLNTDLKSKNIANQLFMKPWRYACESHATTKMVLPNPASPFRFTLKSFKEIFLLSLLNH